MRLQSEAKIARKSFINFYQLIFLRLLNVKSRRYIFCYSYFVFVLLSPITMSSQYTGVIGISEEVPSGLS